MEPRFDSLAKAVSGAVSRRQALWRLGSGLAVGVLALFGLGAGSQHQTCGQCCAFACANLDEPPRGPEMALCIQNCHETGIAAGPTGQASQQCVKICA